MSYTILIIRLDNHHCLACRSFIYCHGGCGTAAQWVVRSEIGRFRQVIGRWLDIIGRSYGCLGCRVIDIQACISEITLDAIVYLQTYLGALAQHRH